MSNLVSKSVKYVETVPGRAFFSSRQLMRFRVRTWSFVNLFLTRYSYIVLFVFDPEYIYFWRRNSNYMGTLT